MVFDSRRHAGRLLAKELKKRNVRPDLVYGLARGGVAVAAEIAAAFKAPLEPLIVRKISPPGNPEFAIGAIAGIPGSDPSAVRSVAKNRSEPSKISVWWDEETIRRLGLFADWQKQQIKDKKTEISNYLIQLNFRKNHTRPGQSLRKIILVDDGAATGATMLAALSAVRKGLSLAYLPAEERTTSRERIVREVGEWQAKAGAKESPYKNKNKIIVALPVVSTAAAEKIKQQVDETVILHQDPDFRAVGQYYRQFEQVSWEEVREILKESRIRAK